MKKSKPQKSAGENGAGRANGGHEFLIVGIGASAGGIQALKEFFEHVPAESGVAYVVILHLSPDHDSRLAEVLQTAAQIPVTQVKERVKVEPDHVYVVPPNQHLGMYDGHIVVEQNVSIEERRAPVDIFFRTLAESHHARAIAVVLSGTGANGSMGIKRVKERGGAAFVQNPREAEFSEMPRNSIATELIDAVLNVREIPAKIIAYKENLGTVEIPARRESRPEEETAALREIFTVLRVRTGHDFSNYKRPTVLRRIERRINVCELESLPAYADFIKENTDEAQSLLKDLLISVTNFFRDREAFEFLERDVVPRIVQDKTSQDQIRVWVAGCATGEEAYSLAMLFAEQTETSPVAPAIQIFATDIDEAAIAAAREGFYTLNDAADISPERLRRFFTKEGDGFRVRRELREMILFANHNLLKDAPFSHLDLVTCRNLLIYFNDTAQERAMETFHFALNPGSFLLLGASESVDGAGDLYAAVSKDHHIYQSRQAAARIAYPVPDAPPAMRYVEPKTAAANAAGMSQEQEHRLLERISFGDLHQQLLEQYAPPSIVVNENHDIVHLSQRAGRFLQVAGGELSKNLLHLIRPELRLELRAALFQAVQRRANVVAPNLKVQTNGHAEIVNIQVRPVLREEDTARGFLLVLFEPSSEDAAEASERILASDEPVARRLEEELERTKAQLRTSVEQYEIQTEELRASNEELQAMNEELRSTAEELETSREELQSVNEELMTVNQELKIKIEELSISNNDFKNLLNSTDIGTIFLDRSLRIKMFTPPVREVFNLIDADINRPLADITTKLNFDDLHTDVERVLDTLHAVEREFVTAAGKWYLLRVFPYRTSEDKINGVVVTLFDITGRKAAEEAVRQSEERYRSLFETMDEAYYVIEMLFDADNKPVDYRFIESNPAFEKLTGLKNAAGKTVRELVPEIEEFWIQKYGEVALTGEPNRYSNRVAGLNDRWYDGYAFRLGGEQSRLVAIIFSEITTRKQAEEKLRQSEEKYRSLFNSIDEGFCTVEVLFDENERPVDYRFLETNPTFETQTGLVAATGRTMVEMKPNHESFWFETYGKVALSGESVRFESYAAALNRWFSVYALRVGEPENRQVAIVFSDITERKRAEEILRESEARFRRAFEIETVGIIFFNAKGDFTGANEAFLSMSGHSREDMTSGKTDWRDLTPPEWMERSEQAFEELLTEGRTTPYEKEYFRKDGSRFWALFAASRINEDENVEYVLDITESKRAEERLRESEERLRLIMESVKDFAIITTDTDGIVTGWRPGAEKAFGWTAQEIVGRSNEVTFTPEDRERGVPAQEMKTAREKGSAADERWHVRKDGSRFYVSGVMSPVRHGGELTGYVKIARDLTEQRRAEEALHRAHEELEDRVRSRTLELAEANVSLQAEIVERRASQAARVELLRQLVRTQEDERRRIAREMHDQFGQQLTALILKLGMLKAECGAQKELCDQLEALEMVARQLDADVDFFVWELRPTALDDLGLQLALTNYAQNWSKHFGVPVEVHENGMNKYRLNFEIETAFYRIAQEALNNVAKHAGATSVSILLERRAGSVSLIVEDDGCGFDEENTSVSGDRGLGLAGMRERAALLGGSVEIESATGEGTTIIARIPTSHATAARARDEKGADE
ncbi:MAG TPA: PAS domain S-box protein [Pyrinomonadaceae bacterium]